MATQQISEKNIFLFFLSYSPHRSLDYATVFKTDCSKRHSEEHKHKLIRSVDICGEKVRYLDEIKWKEIIS